MPRQEPMWRQHVVTLHEALNAGYRAGLSLTDPAMIHISQKLDQLIIEWYAQHERPRDKDNVLTLDP